MTESINTKLKDFVEFVAFLGFLVTATLLINLNFRGFKFVFGEKVRSYWWLFLLLTIVPLLVILYIFSLLFR